MGEEKYNIIVIGDDHYNTYGIIRSLGEVGVQSCVIVLGRDKGKSFVLKSKYIAKAFCCKTHQDAIKVFPANVNFRITA